MQKANRTSLERNRKNGLEKKRKIKLPTLIGGVLSILLLTLLVFSSSLHAEEVPQEAPVNPYFLSNETSSHDPSVAPYALGHREGPLMPEIHRTSMKYPLSRQATLPVYDLRDPNLDGDRSDSLLSPVKDQSTCNACWAFGSYSSLEGNLKKTESTEYDFSENNLIHRHGFDPGPCDGGNAGMTSAYLARFDGPVNELDDPYNPSPYGQYCPDCPPVRYADNHVNIPARADFTDNTYVKQALIDFGPLYFSFRWENGSYNAVDATYYYNGADAVNHGCVIVGWDDDKVVSGAPGTGVFIVRNSWGPLWGDEGYFYISYYDTKALTFGSWAFADAPESNFSFTKTYAYDPLGWVSSVGYGDGNDSAANIFTPEIDGQLTGVGVYLTSAETYYEIQVYDQFDGLVFSEPMTKPQVGSRRFSGYYTIPLTTPVNVTAGDSFAVVVHFNNNGTNAQPLPIEKVFAGYTGAASANPGESYISANGIEFYDLTDYNSTANICIKAFVDEVPTQPPVSPFGEIPDDGAVDRPVTTDLSWQCSDPDGDDLTYNLYLDTEYPPERLEGERLDETSFDPGVLQGDTTTYYWRVDAVDAHGATTEGPVWQFTTEAITVRLPDLYLDSVDNLTKTTADVGVVIVDAGGPPAFAHGVCWDTVGNPDIRWDDHINVGAIEEGSGGFESHIEGLTPETTYYVRPYATNVLGTAYGDVLSFETQGGTVQFTDSKWRFGEGEGSVTVYVSRTDGGDGPVSVNYGLDTGGAGSIDDFVFSPGTLYWQDGDRSDKGITITLLDDSIHEFNESIFLTLSDPVNARLGSPWECVVKIVDDDAGQLISGWRHIRQDLTGSNAYPGDSVQAVDGLRLTASYPLPGNTTQLLTGNVVGDDDLEVVTVQNRTLYIFSSTGELLSMRNIAISGIPDTSVSMLEDLDGDGFLDIGVAYARGNSNWGDMKARIYNGEGSLLKEFTKRERIKRGYPGHYYYVYSDGSMYPETIIGDQVVLSYNAGYGRYPRGFSLWDYSNAAERWIYKVGPARTGSLSIADMDQDGFLEFSYSSDSYHYGAYANGTGDWDTYYIIVDETGANRLTRKYYQGNSNGSLYNYFFKPAPSDGPYHLLSLKQYDPRHRGTSRVDICDLNGNTIHTFVGLPNSRWSSAWADIDNDGSAEVVVGNTNDSAHALTLLDAQLDPLAARAPSTQTVVSAITDLDQDADYEILVYASDLGLVQVLDTRLDEKYGFSVPTDEVIRNVIVSESAPGTKQILVLTNRNIHFLNPDLNAPGNQVPVITSDGGGEGAEIHHPEGEKSVSTVQATDPDGDVMTYFISGGADAEQFFLGGRSGELKFTITPDVNSPGDADGDNVYAVEVTATDGFFSDMQTITVIVDDVNEPPVIVNTIPDQVLIENSPTRSIYLTRYESDNEDSGTLLNWHVEGVSGTRFTASVSSGTYDYLRLTPLPGASGTETITLVLTDSEGLADSQDITVTVHPNDPPAQPFGEEPVNGATFAFVSSDLSWQCSDPDGDALRYDVRLDTVNPPEREGSSVSNYQPGTTYDPGILAAETTYYWQVCAIDEHGERTWGDVWHFTTEEYSTWLPEVTTGPVTDITTATAVGNGSVMELGRPAPTAHGVCWNTEGVPDLTDTCVDVGWTSTEGPFSGNITGLSPNTTYYVRAYATNNLGTVYGGEVMFVTDPLPPPGGTVQFLSSKWSAGEDEGAITLTVQRTGGSFGSISVDYTVDDDGTATLGQDFTLSAGTLHWADGDVTEKTVTVTLLDDSEQESTESIHIRLNHAVGGSLGSPSSATVKIRDDEPLQGISGWPHVRQNLSGSNYYPGSSDVAVLGLTETVHHPLSGTNAVVLTGNVSGDETLEAVTVQENTLYIFSLAGDLLLIRDIAIAGIPESRVTMLEDVNGDGLLDIGVSYHRGDYNDGALKARLYDGRGSLLREFSKPADADGRLTPETVIDGQVLMTQNAGASKSPRGVSLWNYMTGSEQWHYNIGPSMGPLSIADTDQDGFLEVTMGNDSTHQGISSNGTWDGDTYVLIVDETGTNQLTALYSEGSPDGSIENYFIRLTSSNEHHILSLKGYDPTYYWGGSKAHICDLNGNVIHSIPGLPNGGWSSAWGDIDNDGSTDIVLGSTNDSSCTITRLDHQLEIVASISPSTRTIVNAIADVDQDSDREIVVYSPETGLVQVLDSRLEGKYAYSVPLGDVIQNVIVSDMGSQGDRILLVLTDLGLYFVQPDDTVAANSPPEITSDGGGETADLQRSENGTVVTTVQATDPEEDLLTYLVTGGADATLFTLGARSGDLNFTVPPDFETPNDADGDNRYAVEVSVTDGFLSDMQAITVTVVNANDPPAPPTDETPVNGATGISVHADLSWSGSDPDGDALTFDVYFGTANPPTTPVATGQSDLTYDPGTLQYSTTYYWRVDAEDEHGVQTTGNVWHFTTEAEPQDHLPAVTTQAATQTTTTTATGNGTITDPGLPVATAHGVCWNTTGDPDFPDLNDPHTDEGAVDGAASFPLPYSSDITGLSPDTTYYVRAYATNTLGTSFGNELAFTTARTPAGFYVGDISGNTGEDGTAATFTVSLTAAPHADVTVPVASSDTGEGAVDRSSLTFTANDWNVDQTVTITGVDDTLKDGDQSYEIRFGAAVSTDAAYSGLTPDPVSVINVDDDSGAGSEIYLPFLNILLDE